MKRSKSILASILCASLMLPALSLTRVSAAPLAKTPAAKSGDGITLVGRGWGHGPGPGGIIAGIIAGTLIAAAIREGRADDRDMRHCAEDFRGFDPRTGTYINRYGEERVCPYLR